MEINDEQKEVIIEKYKQFILISKKINEFEKEIKKLNEEHEKVLTDLENIRKEVNEMEANFCLDEEGKESYKKFLNDILLGKVKLD